MTDARSETAWHRRNEALKASGITWPSPEYEASAKLWYLAGWEDHPDAAAPVEVPKPPAPDFTAVANPVPIHQRESQD